MIHIAEERDPMNLIRVLLLFDRVSPVELLHDSPVTQYQFAVPELGRQTHDQRAEHVISARGILVWCEVAALRIDVQGVKLRRDGFRVVWDEFSLNLSQDAVGFGVEIVDGNSFSLGLELNRVAHTSIVPSLFTVSKRCWFALFEQRRQLVRLLKRILRTNDFESRLISEDQRDWLVRDEFPFA